MYSIFCYFKKYFLNNCHLEFILKSTHLFDYQKKKKKGWGNTERQCIAYCYEWYLWYFPSLLSFRKKIWRYIYTFLILEKSILFPNNNFFSSQFSTVWYHFFRQLTPSFEVMLHKIIYLEIYDWRIG